MRTLQGDQLKGPIVRPSVITMISKGLHKTRALDGLLHKNPLALVVLQSLIMRTRSKLVRDHAADLPPKGLGDFTSFFNNFIFKIF